MAGLRRRLREGTVGTQVEAVLDFIVRFPGRDDDEIASAMKITPRQTINQICRKLSDAGLLRRERGRDGKLVNFVIRTNDPKLADAGASTQVPRIDPAGATHVVTVIPERRRVMSADDAPSDWFWEGNVVDAVERYLSSCGWAILSKADTSSKERGEDIAASKNGKILLVEAKGYPSTAYRDPRRAAEQKPTNPSNQAQHWYSHALLKALRLQSKRPEAKIAIAFPDFPRYRVLFRETQDALEKLGIGFLLIGSDGNVESWHLE
jgi:hypothetical protein